MTTAGSAESMLPPRTLRVGVTGARKLRADQTPRIETAVRDVLSMVRDHLPAAIPAPATSSAASQPDGSLRLLSALARGADRLAAEQALALGYQLFVPMPFPRPDYARDFQGSEDPDEPPISASEDLAQFNHLLEIAGDHWLALDGSRDVDRDRAYEAVGRFVVRHSDILIAVWDEAAERGRGGTVDIVRYAAHVGVPVWWIEAASDGPPQWVIDPQDLHGGRAMQTTPQQCLTAYLTTLLRPPQPHPRHRHHWIGWLARLGQSREVSPLHDYLGERELPTFWLWNVHSWVMRTASGIDVSSPPTLRPARADAAYWFDRFLPADARAGAYASRFRSGHVWVVLLGLLGLSCGAVLPLVKPPHGHSTMAILAMGAELTTLVLMVGMAIAAIRLGWHERFIAYRLLAELCRKQQVLTYLGWTVATGLVRRLASEDHLTWVTWLFAAYQRAAPLPQGEMATVMQGEAWHAVLDGLIEQQLRYHITRTEMSEKASRRFSTIGAACFAVVVLCVAIKFADTWLDWLHPAYLYVGLLATLLPGISAVFVAIGAFAELQMMADESRHMAGELRHAKERLERLRHLAPGKPLASQDLGNQAAAVASLMLQDLDGWARLFRLKVIEAG
jgi:hypothetical protein